jgi:hypothetical protein
MRNRRVLATILAALRAWQHLRSPQDVPAGSSSELVTIATDDGSFEPLSIEEIDTLCELINCDGPQSSNLTASTCSS